MAIFSVYNYDTKHFDYFEVPGKSHHQLGDASHAFRKVNGNIGLHNLGTTAEKMAASVPANAKPAGSGLAPKGVIARMDQPKEIPVKAVLVLAGIGLFLYTSRKKR